MEEFEQTISSGMIKLQINLTMKKLDPVPRGAFAAVLSLLAYQV